MSSGAYLVGDGWTCLVCNRFVRMGEIHNCPGNSYGNYNVTYTGYPNEVQLLREEMERRMGVLENKLDMAIKISQLIDRIDKILAEWEREDEQESKS